MFKRKTWFGILVFIVLFGVVGIAFALESDGSWTRSGDPTLRKIADLPDNTTPSVSNFPCLPITARYINETVMRNLCMQQTPYGLADSNKVVFTGSSEAVKIEPQAYVSSVSPVPGQSAVIGYSSAPVVGVYMHLYSSILSKIRPAYDSVTHALRKYTLNAPPDFSFRDTDGRLMPVNPDNMAFSSNGNWMVIELYSKGFVRVNMSTFEVIPFAPAFNGAGDYTSHQADISVSNDGRYVAIKPVQWERLEVYDVQSCRDSSLPVDRLKPKCQLRDYWPSLKTQVPSFNNAFEPHFINGTQLSLAVKYDTIGPNNFKVAYYTLTAPGESPSGIQYLGMGDSYASGQGAFNYIQDTDTATNGCHTSGLSYPLLLSSLLFASGHSVACSGARIIDVTSQSEVYKGQTRDGIARKDRNNSGTILMNFSPGYLSQLEFAQTHSPQVLSLSIGGNDIGFADIVKQCVMPTLKDNTCFNSYEDQVELKERITAIGSKLRSAYLLLAAPGRVLYVIGYPQIVKSGGSCAANVHLSNQEIILFNDLTDVLNQTIKTAAESVGARYVDVSDALNGHRMCEGPDNQVAVNGLTAGNEGGFGSLKIIGAESYHPNAFGHELLMRTILARTDNLQSLAVNPPSSPSGELPLANAPKTGRPTKVSASDSNLLPDVVNRNLNIPVSVDSSSILLPPNATYDVKLDAGGPSVSSITTDTLGVVAGYIILPKDIGCGYHTLHVLGPNMLNQPVDIHKVIYVTGADCSGALPDSGCGDLPSAHVDQDNDGIDDGCDPVIGTISNGVYYQVHLTGSSIQARAY